MIFFRLFGSLVLCLAWIAGVGSFSMGDGLPGLFFALYTLLLYAWWLYLPVMGLHWLLNRVLRPSQQVSALAGAALGGLVPGLAMLNEYNPAFITPSIPRFSVSRTLDLVNYVIAGALYGLLYWRWIAKRPHAAKH